MQVNQRYWLQLRPGEELQGRLYTFDMCLVPQYLPKDIEDMGVLEHLMYAAYRGQGSALTCRRYPPGGQGSCSDFSGSCMKLGANFTQPLPGYIYIH